LTGAVAGFNFILNKLNLLASLNLLEKMKVVRGGSFFDRPARCRSRFRWAYLAWQRVFHIGFRVVVVDEILQGSAHGGGTPVCGCN
jgi:hypothetical protein